MHTSNRKLHEEAAPFANGEGLSEDQKKPYNSEDGKWAEVEEVGWDDSSHDESLR